MPTFSVTSPDGRTFSVTTPPGATEDDAIAYVQKQLGQGEDESPFGSKAALAAAVAAAPRDLSLGTLFSRGLSRGATQMESLFGDVLPALGANIIGADEYAKQQMEEAAATQQQLQETNAPAYSSYKDIKGIGDILPFAAESLGEQGANLASMLIPGGAGAVLGRRAALGAAERALAGTAEKRLAVEGAEALAPEAIKEETARLAATEAGERMLGAAGGRGAVTGAQVGVGAALFPTNIADTFQNIYDKTGEMAPLEAILGGSVVGLLDMYSPASVINAFRSVPGLKAEVATKIAEGRGLQAGVIPFAKALAGGAAKGAVREAGTEMAQEEVSILAEQIAGDLQKTIGPEEIDRILTAGAKALAPGAVFGGVEGMGVRSRELGETQRQQEEIAQREAEAQRIQDEANELSELQTSLPDLEQQIADLQDQLSDPTNPTRKSAQVQLDSLLDDYNTKTERFRFLNLTPEERAAEEAAQVEEEEPGAAPTTTGKPAPAEGTVEAVLAGLGIDRQKALTAIKAFNKEPGVTKETAFSIPLDAPVRGDIALQLDKFLDRYKATPEEAQAIDELRQTLPELQPDNIYQARRDDHFAHLATSVDLKPKDVGNWYQKALFGLKPGEDDSADYTRWTQLTFALDQMKNKSAKMALDSKIKADFPEFERIEAERVARMTAEQKKADEAAKNVAMWSKIADAAKAKQEKAAAKAAAIEAKKGGEEARKRIAEAMALTQAKKAKTEVPPGVAWTPEALQSVVERAQKEQAKAQAKAEKQRVKETVAGAAQLGAQSRAQPQFVAKVQQFTPEFLKSRKVYPKSKLGQILTATPVRSLEDVERIAKQVEEKVNNPDHQKIAEGIINDLRTAMAPKAEVRESRAPEEVTTAATPEAVRSALEQKMGRDVNAVSITRTPEEAGLTGVNPRAKGAVVNGRAHLFTQNIEPGRELGTFLHEVGDHLGMKKLVGEGNYAFLVNKVQEWAGKGGDSLEARIARAAMARIPEGTKASDEALAYFIEEAVDNFGVNPSQIKDTATPLGIFFRKLLAGIKNVLAKLGMKVDPSAQDVVDLAYGAAHMGLRETGPTYYSQLARAIEGAKQTAMPAKQWVQWLDANAAKLGVKKDELENSNVKEFLESQDNRKVTKDELAAQIREGGTKVEETILRNEPIKGGGWEEAEGGTKYGEYTLPGGENYREVLLRLPFTNKFVVVNEEGNVVDERRFNTEAEARAVAEEWNGGVGRERKEQYRSSHWDQPNVLAHIRLNDRTDADGNKVLFVEEIQSDWAQEGRRKGFNNQIALERKRRVDALNEELRSIKTRLRELPAGPATDEVQQLRNREETIYRQLRDLSESESANEGIPAAPFVTDTEAWTKLAIKRIIRMAAEEGYDKVAFVNGTQSADRYDLSKQVDKIVWNEKTGDLAAQRVEGGDTIKHKNVTKDKLADLIGKDPADRLINAREISGWRAIEGDDLKVGGEGMKAFYDKIVPQVVRKVLKDVGGDGLEEVRLSDGSEQLGFTVTPEMRATALEGQPLFSLQSVTETPAFKKWFGDSKVVDESGKPLIMYHGTTRGGFTVFDRLKTLEWRGPSMDTVGSWFSDNPSSSGGAGAYAEAGGKGDVIYPVYLSIKNPKIYRTFNDFLRDMHQAAGRPVPENAPGRGTTEELRAKLMKEGYDGIEFEQTANESLMQDFLDTQDAVRRAKQEEASVHRTERLPYTQKRNRLEKTLESMRKELDYFGSSTEFDNQRVFVAFHPEQIKSATGNIGTFDETNPDIRYSIAPDQKTVKKVYDQTFERLGTTIRNTPVWKNDSARSVLGAMSNLPGKTKKFLYYAAPLYQLADMAETFSPQAAKSIRDLEKLLGMRKEKSTERVNAISKLLERNTAKMKKFSAKQIEDFEEIAHELSRLQIDPEDEKFRNEPLYKRFHASPKELKEVFFDVVKKYAADADAFLDLMDKLTEGAFSPEMKVKYKLMVKRIYPYLPLYREGEYWMGYTDAAGEPVIQSFESELDRNLARQDAINAGIKADKIDYFKQLADITPDKMRPTKELASLIKVMEEKNVSPVVRDKAYQMFLQLFPAGSVMQQFKKRQGRKGYRPEMLQNFAVVNSRMADALTQFEYAPNINRVYADLNNELLKRGKSGTDEAIDLLDEMNARGEYLRSPANNYYANLASSVSYNQYLLGNISSSVMNTTGLPMITLPMLGGEYGWNKASSAMSNALSAYMNGGRDDNSTMKSYFTGRSLADKTFMGDKVRAAAEKAPKYSKLYNMKRLYDAALAQQAIHQSVGIDVTGRKKTSAGDYVGRWATTKASLGWLFQNSERMNREVTLLAAFNLELDKLRRDPKLTDEQRVQTAINKAVELVKRTQGPAMTETGGRIFQSDVGKVIGTFKKYPMTQLYLIGDLFNDAFRGADAETKAIARKQLAGILGMGMTFTGIKGLPLVGAATFIASLLFGDDDEPFDANQRGLEIFGQLGWNGLVNSLTGLRVSDRMAIGQFFRDDPKRLSEIGPIWYAAEQIIGPIAGMAKNYQDAYELLNDGRPLKALERAMPLAISNGIKAVDQAVNGVRTKEGARITDDPNLYNLVMQGVGFQSEAKARAGEINSIENQIETAVIARRTKLLADLWRNRNDSEALAKTNAAIQKFNASKYGKLYPIKSESRIRSKAQYTAKVKAAEQHGGMAPNMKLAPSFRALEEAAGGP